MSHHPQDALHHEHTLNRIVPAMEGGFVIQTTYGDLTIEPGPLANRIRNVVALHAQMELDRQKRPGMSTAHIVRRFVKADMSINYGGQRFCLRHLPDVRPGDVVEVLPGAPGCAPVIQAANAGQVAQQPTADAQRSPQGFPYNAPVIGEGWGCRCQHHAPELEF